ncbi:MAG: hypothetical protein ACE5LH_00095 [Fidelibacterota bacterium]
MVSLVSLLTFTVFASLYPLFLWLVRSHGVSRGFHRFTLALTSAVAGMATAFLWFREMPVHIRLSGVAWWVSLLAVTGFFWNRSRAVAWVVSVPPVLGLIVYGEVLTEVIGANLLWWAVWVVAGLILSGAVFSMVLGHWYLNVPGLPIVLFRRSVGWLVSLLVIRGVWDAVTVAGGDVQLEGQVISVIDFIQSFDGFFLFFALLFGTVIPLGVCVLALKTIAIRSTQSATGLLYIVVISVVMGDLFYKFYALQYGLLL